MKDFSPLRARLRSLIQLEHSEHNLIIGCADVGISTSIYFDLARNLAPALLVTTAVDYLSFGLFWRARSRSPLRVGCNFTTIELLVIVRMNRLDENGSILAQPDPSPDGRSHERNPKFNLARSGISSLASRLTSFWET